MDLANPEEVVKELFDPNERIREEFAHTTSASALAFSEAFAKAYARFPSLQELCQHNVQTSLVGAFLHGVLNDLLGSVKLLLVGFAGPSGNLVRQALEGICMSAMCAHDGPLSIGNKDVTYWKLIASSDASVEGNYAGRQFYKNKDRLGLNETGVKQLLDALELHHQNSHAGTLAMAHRMLLGDEGKLTWGGQFDPTKIEGYNKELEQRAMICRWLLELMDELRPRLLSLAKTQPPVSKGMP